ncbi:MAG: FtsX-like permease family protein [Bryobacteraceae bacterium]
MQAQIVILQIRTGTHHDHVRRAPIGDAGEIGRRPRHPLAWLRLRRTDRRRLSLKPARSDQRRVLPCQQHIPPRRHGLEHEPAVVAGSRQVHAAAARPSQLDSDPRKPRHRLQLRVKPDRILALLSTFFGGLALLLACIGLYGVLSYVLARRTTEIGVRLALGARPGEVASMVLRESAMVVVLGIAVGVAAALGLSRLVRQFLFGLDPTDPATILLAAATLSLVVFLAALLPARRASRLDPMNALRTE